jgi:hypothetical protein
MNTRGDACPILNMLAVIREDLSAIRIRPIFRKELAVETSQASAYVETKVVAPAAGGDPIPRLPDSAGSAAAAHIRKYMTASDSLSSGHIRWLVARHFTY